MAWSPTLALGSWVKPSPWSAFRDCSPACMLASASSRHSASLPGGDAELAAEGIECLAAEDAEDDLGLVATRPATIFVALAFVGSARAPRSLRRRRRLVSWLLDGVMHFGLESQMDVSGNCAAHHRLLGLPHIRKFSSKQARPIEGYSGSGAHDQNGWFSVVDGGTTSPQLQLWSGTQRNDALLVPVH
jgi:hypothetical protein